MSFVVEYSVRQNCFNISDLQTILETNKRTSIQQIDNDYRIIGIFSDYKEASKYAKEFRKLIERDE